MSVSVSIVAISWLRISRSLAIVSMVSITITTISTIVAISWLSSSIGLSLSLAISITMVSITTIAISMTVSMAISMTIVAISWLSNNHSKEGNGKSSLKTQELTFQSTFTLLSIFWCLDFRKGNI